MEPTIFISSNETQSEHIHDFFDSNKIKSILLENFDSKMEQELIDGISLKKIEHTNVANNTTQDESSGFSALANQTNENTKQEEEKKESSQ